MPGGAPARQVGPAGCGRGSQTWASIELGAPGVQMCEQSQWRREVLSPGGQAGGSTLPRLRARECWGTRRQSSGCDEGGCRACALGPAPPNDGIEAARGRLRGRSAPATRAPVEEYGLCHAGGCLGMPSAKIVPGRRRKGRHLAARSAS